MCFLFTPKIFSHHIVRGASCLQTDDTLDVGKQPFVKLENDKGHQLERKPISILQESGSMEFNGCNIKLNQNIYSIRQAFHLNHLNELCSSQSVDKSEFVRHPARGAYIASIYRPDLSASFARLSQYQVSTIEDTTTLNKLMRKAKTNHLKFNFIKLDISTIRLWVFTDARFASNRDHSSRLGYIIALVDAQKNSNLLQYSSFESRRIARSARAAERLI